MTRRAPQARSEETRHRIFDAALTLFRERGFEETTMREIAQAAGVAVGAAYYYFESKEAIVLAFYDRAQEEMTPLLHAALTREKKLERRLQAVLAVKFNQFRPNRSLLGALASQVDPRKPLSPFNEATSAIRDKDIATLAEALDGSNVRIPPDLRTHLPRVLWMYQMGLILFWIFDGSPDQMRTLKLTEKSVAIVTNLIRLSAFPLLRPVRKSLIELLELIYRDPDRSF